MARTSRLFIRLEGASGDGESYLEMLTRMAEERRVETPTMLCGSTLNARAGGCEALNQDWTSTTDPEARIAKMKVELHASCLQAEHAADLDTGVILAVFYPRGR